MRKDIIFATHPHSIQPIDILKSSDGLETPVVYSMGNFLSSQRTERIQNPYTEDGVIVSVKVEKDLTTNEIKVKLSNLSANLGLTGMKRMEDYFMKWYLPL